LFVSSAVRSDMSPEIGLHPVLAHGGPKM